MKMAQLSASRTRQKLPQKGRIRWIYPFGIYNIGRIERTLLDDIGCSTLLQLKKGGKNISCPLSNHDTLHYLNFPNEVQLMN